MVASSTEGPVIVVIGATGAQGGSVVSALLRSDRPYQIHAVSRDPSKPSAQALASKGCTVVSGDVSKPQDLQRLFKGAQLVFAVTNYWEHQSAEKELADGKAIIDAAKDAGVELFIWSGLEPVSKISGGKLDKVHHFDSKAAITDYAKSTGIPLAVVEPGCYSTNFVGMLGPQKQPDGSIAVALPVSSKTVVSLLNPSEDYGAYVREAIESPSFGAGSTVYAASEELTLEEMVKQWSEVTGKPATYKQIPVEAYVSAGGHLGEEMYQMLAYFQDYGYYGGADIGPSQASLAQPVGTWKQLVAKSDWSKLDQ
ncbi:NmrA family transcriptional regulator [Leucosporidium creatinivorum]|uniref:NmrA family transcriptional regulator n=1 Tax=Leucosporidium creatinivorum TaxID=106004 RepID=A0A1Y2DE59_9BASI|nr:NmrA family transcriptional regulator [Leucosporidium creatinivorum]